MPSWVKLFESVSTKTVIHNDPIKGLGKKILELVSPPAKILEVGFGSGALAGYLQDFGYSVVGVDRDAEVVAYAKKRLKAEMLGMPVLIQGNAFELARGLVDMAPFSLSWSQGLLEHFNDQDIKELLCQQLLVAETVVFSVPSDNYPRQEFGDERNLPLTHWFELCRQLFEIAEPTLSYYGGPEKNQHILGVLRRRKEELCPSV